MLEMHLLPHTQGATVTALTDQLINGYSQGMLAMGLHRLHEAGFTGKGMKVGIIDSGIDYQHPDLRDKVKQRRDYVNDGLTPDLYNLHGTHVGGTVGANGRLIGAAPECEILDYRVLDANGNGSWQNVAKAIMDAEADGCDVINLSLGGPGDIPALHEAVIAYTKKAPCITACGNEGPETISYPAYYPEVIAVGAGELGLDGVWRRAFFSTTNPEVDVMAPGYNVLSTIPGGNYMYLSGTSMGAPHVTGIVACKLQRGKARLGRPMTEPSIWEDVKCDTVDVESLGIDAASGAGFVTIYPMWRKPVEVQVTEGANKATVDGVEQELVPGYPDAKAETRDGFFSLPMAFVARVMAGSKAWNENTRTGTFWIPRQ